MSPKQRNQRQCVEGAGGPRRDAVRSKPGDLVRQPLVQREARGARCAARDELRPARAQVRAEVRRPGRRTRGQVGQRPGRVGGGQAQVLAAGGRSAQPAPTTAQGSGPAQVHPERSVIRSAGGPPDSPVPRNTRRGAPWAGRAEPGARRARFASRLLSRRAWPLRRSGALGEGVGPSPAGPTRGRASAARGPGLDGAEPP